MITPAKVRAVQADADTLSLTAIMEKHGITEQQALGIVTCHALYHAGNLDGGVPNHFDHTKRGFDPQ